MLASPSNPPVDIFISEKWLLDSAEMSSLGTGQISKGLPYTTQYTEGSIIKWVIP